MSKLASFLLIPALLCAAIGDKAPSIPSTYVTTHPRLGAPTTAWLNALYGTGAGVYTTVYKNAANAWTNSGTIWNCRYTVTAYLAEQLNSGPNEASYLTKVKAMYQATNPGCQALAYDWAYASLDASDKTNFITALRTSAAAAAAVWSAGQGSVYNDSAYLTSTSYLMWLGIVLYPDDTSDCSGTPCGIYYLRVALDLWLNHMMPAWRQQFSRDGKGTTGSDADNGGSWQEGWGDYVNSTGQNGMNIWIMPPLLAWANASGRGTAFFITDHPWLRNYGYWTPYLVRPDWTVHRINQVSFGIFQNDYFNWVRINSGVARLGSIEAIAAIYDDPDLRGWARKILWNGNMPDGYEPAAFPWFAPDSSANSAVCSGCSTDAEARSGMAKVKNFPGSGTIFFRTGFGENDVSIWWRYGNEYWSHPTFDTGAYAGYKRGALTIHGGTYRPGANVRHQLYAASTLSHNTIGICDPDDYFTDEIFNTAPDPDITLPNDCGQRRTGSNYQNDITNDIVDLGRAPADIGQWRRWSEGYTRGKLLAYAIGTDGKYAYAAANITPAYSNTFSRAAHTSAMLPFESNRVNRTYRADKVIRHVLFIPRGTSAYWITFDQVKSTVGEKETLTETDFTTHANWDVTGDFSDSGGSADYTHSTGTGTLSQAFANFAKRSVEGTLYRLNYTVSSYVGDGACNITTALATENTALTMSNGAQSTTFVTGAVAEASKALTISCTSTSGSFTLDPITLTQVNPKQNWIHTINEPTLGSYAGGKTYTATRADLVQATSTTCTGWALWAAQLTNESGSCGTSNWKYQYDGKLYGFVPDLPGATTILQHNVGGSGKEFWMDGVQWKECPVGGNCTANHFGSNPVDEVNGDPLWGTVEPGAWRVVQTPATASDEDWFLNLQLYTTPGETNVVSTNPTVTAGGSGLNLTWIMTWKDASDGCTYTATFSQKGIGGSITATGAGCVATI